MLKYGIMVTEPQKQKLTLRAVARSIINQVITDTNPVFRYKVVDERGEEVAFITNTRASGATASWELSRLKDGHIGESAGNYATAEDALSVLQKEVGKAP